MPASRAHRACVKVRGTGGQTLQLHLNESSFQYPGQQPIQAAYLADQHHGQGRIPTLPQPLTYTRDIHVGNQAALRFKTWPYPKQPGWVTSTKAEGVSTPITKLQLFLKPDSPILPWRRRAGQKESLATRDRRTWERNCNTEHCERELWKLKINKTFYLPCFFPGSAVPRIHPTVGTWTHRHRRKEETHQSVKKPTPTCFEPRQLTFNLWFVFFVLWFVRMWSTWTPNKKWELLIH